MRALRDSLAAMISLMGERFRAISAAWLDAQQRAFKAQNELGDKLQAYIDGNGPAPSESDRHEVRRLNEVAAANLALALEYLDATTRKKIH
jgi:hypothetical protein